MAIEIFNYNSILIELSKAVKMHNFYPQGHPNLDTALGKCFMLMKKVQEERGDIAIRIDVKGFYDGKNPIGPGIEEITHLARKFFFRKVREITFTRRVGQGEIKKLLELLKLEPEELQAKGGPESYLAGSGVSGILLNEMSYEALKNLKREFEEKKEGEEIEAAVDEERPQAAQGGADEAAEEKLKPKMALEAEKELSALLERIREETDFLRYYDLSVRVKEKTDPLILEKKLDEAYPVLLLFLEHSSPTSGLATDIKEAALERLDEFLKHEDMLRHLVFKAGGRDETSRGEVQKMLARSGERAVDLLLDAIVEAPDAGTRRNVFNTLLSLGRSITPFVVRRLANERWFEVRQMVSLLGEMGDPDSVAPLSAAFGHADPRVKRAVLKSLARIRSPRSVEFLIQAVSEEDPALSSQAIISLGMLRDPSAVGKLAELALKWEPFRDEQETKKEAIKALGIIGDQKAVPHLVKVLLRKTWFGRRLNDDFRVLAANSLSMIGGKDAFEAIEKAYRGSGGELYNTCKRIIEGREKTL